MSEERVEALESKVAKLEQLMAGHCAEAAKMHEKIESLLVHVVDLCSMQKQQTEEAAAGRLPELPTVGEELAAPLNCGERAAPEKFMNTLNYFIFMWSTDAEFRTRYAAARVEPVSKGKKPKTPEELLKSEARETHKNLANLPELKALYAKEHGAYKAGFA